MGTWWRDDLADLAATFGAFAARYDPAWEGADPPPQSVKIRGWHPTSDDTAPFAYAGRVRTTFFTNARLLRTPAGGRVLIAQPIGAQRVFTPLFWRLPVIYWGDAPGSNLVLAPLRVALAYEATDTDPTLDLLDARAAADAWMTRAPEWVIDALADAFFADDEACLALIREFRAQGVFRP